MMTSGGNARDGSISPVSAVTAIPEGLSMGSTYDSGNQPVWPLSSPANQPGSAFWSIGTCKKRYDNLKKKSLEK